MFDILTDDKELEAIWWAIRIIYDEQLPIETKMAAMIKHREALLVFKERWTENGQFKGVE